MLAWLNGVLDGSGKRLFSDPIGMKNAQRSLRGFAYFESRMRVGQMLTRELQNMHEADPGEAARRHPQSLLG